MPESHKWSLNRSNIPWNEVAQYMQGQFKDKVQTNGSPLAQITKLSKDNKISAPCYKFPKKLLEDRVGSIERSEKAVKTQAKKYGDIALMLRLSKPYKVRRTKEIPKQRGDETSSSSDTDEDEEEEHVIIAGSNRKRSRSPPPGGDGNRDQDPPGAGGADFAGKITKISGGFGGLER